MKPNSGRWSRSTVKSIGPDRDAGRPGSRVTVLDYLELDGPSCERARVR